MQAFNLQYPLLSRAIFDWLTDSIHNIPSALLNKGNIRINKDFNEDLIMNVCFYECFTRCFRDFTKEDNLNLHLHLNSAIKLINDL